MTTVTQITKTDEGTGNVSENAIKRLLELSKPEAGELEFHVDGSVWKNDKLIAERPDEWQEVWVEKRMRGPAKSWKRWNEE